MALAESWTEIEQAYPPTRDFVDADAVTRLQRGADLFEVRRKQLYARPDANGATSLVETAVVDCDKVAHVSMKQEWYDDAQNLRNKGRWPRSRDEAVRTLATDPLIRNREGRRALSTCQFIWRLEKEAKVKEEFDRPTATGDTLPLPEAGAGATPPGSADRSPADRRPAGAGQLKVGSGFFVSSDGTFVTAAHVVASCSAVSVEGQGVKAGAAYLAMDATRDIAILRASARPRVFAKFAQRQIRQGDQVVSYGFPLAGAISSGGTATTGYVSALTGLRDDQNMLQISAPVQPGHSGGPLVDLSGAVVGMVIGKLRAEAVLAATGVLPENVNFAVKSSAVIDMMKTAKVPHAGMDAASLKSVADVSEDLRGVTVRVNCR
ncbi:MAG TPA: serine protease [Burkholderiales bacterium]|nr:serine protease [Burkholderiales bacterium]